LLVGLLFTALALGLGTWTSFVHARAIGWRDELPMWLFARLAPWDFDDESFRDSLTRRVDEGIDRESAQRVLSGALAVLDANPQLLRPEGARWLPRLGNLALPEGDLGRRFVEACFTFVDIVATLSPEGIAIDVTPVGGHFPTAGSPLIVRIDAVLLYGAELPFNISGTKNESNDRRWHVVGQSPLRSSVAGVTTTDIAAVSVRGRAVYCHLSPQTAGRDATIATSDDPATWGFPIAQASFDRRAASGVSVIPGWWLGTTNSPGQFAPFLYQPSLRSAMPPLFAALLITACAVTGVIVGLGLAIAYAVALLVARVRPRLALPSCRGCGSTLRGAGSTPPPCCSECGRTLVASHAVHWTPRLVRPAIAWCTAVLAIAGVAALAWSFAPAVALDIKVGLDRQLATPERFGEWYGAMCLGKTLPWRAESARMQLGWGNRRSIYMPEHFDDESYQTAQIMAARRITSDWREAPELNHAVPLYLRSRVLQSLARCVNRPTGEGALVWTESQHAAIAAMVLEAGIPSIVFPKCVRVGQPIRILEDDLGNEISAFYRRQVPADEAPPEWTIASSFTYATPQETGDTDCAIEWALVFPSMSEQWKPIPSNEIDRRLQRLPLMGHAHQRVRVLPAGNEEIVVDAPELNPLQRPVNLTINELGERDEIELNAWTYGSGIVMRGEWMLELPNSSVMLVHQPGSSFWTAVAPTPSPLPAELVVRFVPREPDPVFSDRPPKTPSIVWGGQSELRVLRVPWSPPGEVRGVSARFASER